MIVGSCSHYRAPKALCASIAVVIDWAAKSHKMSLTTLFHSYQSVSYFSLSLAVTCLSFPIPRESSSRWLENLPNLFSSAQLISSTGQAVRWHWQRFQHCRCWSTLTAVQFSGPAVWETISGLLVRGRRYLAWTVFTLLVIVYFLSSHFFKWCCSGYTARKAHWVFCPKLQFGGT